jgi:hypothetical protein
MYILRKTHKNSHRQKMGIAFRQNARILKVKLSIRALKLYEGVEI